MHEIHLDFHTPKKIRYFLRIHTIFVRFSRTFLRETFVANPCIGSARSETRPCTSPGGSAKEKIEVKKLNIKYFVGFHCTHLSPHPDVSPVLHLRRRRAEAHPNGPTEKRN